MGTYLIQRFGLTSATPRATATQELEAELEPASETLVVEVDREDTSLMRNIAVLALAMGLGSLVSARIQSLGITLPGYIGAMLVASVLRNLDDSTRWFRIDQRAMEFMGNLALNIFLVVALMSLKLWELAGLALPLLVILVVQVILVLLFALTVSFRAYGQRLRVCCHGERVHRFCARDYSKCRCQHAGAACAVRGRPPAFLIVPLVGAFFIDFTNALIITGFVNWFRVKGIGDL